MLPYPEFDASKLGQYILEGETFRLAKSRREWLEHIEDADARRVAIYEAPGHKAYVSTMFLALDHSFGEHNGPLLFESMAFGFSGGEWQQRYATYEAALTGHNLLVKQLVAELSKCN